MQKYAKLDVKSFMQKKSSDTAETINDCLRIPRKCVEVLLKTLNTEVFLVINHCMHNQKVRAGLECFDGDPVDKSTVQDWVDTSRLHSWPSEQNDEFSTFAIRKWDGEVRSEHDSNESFRLCCVRRTQQTPKKSLSMLNRRIFDSGCTMR
jgi:hypothetical protein